MSENPDPKDMLHIIQQLAVLLGRTQEALQHNHALIQRQCDLDSPDTEKPTHWEWIEAQRSTADILDDLGKTQAIGAPDAG